MKALNMFERNRAPCFACGETMPIALLECPGVIGDRKYVCYACCGQGRPTERGIPREMVDRMMEKYGRKEDGGEPEAARGPLLEARFNNAMDAAEDAVMEAERQGISIEGAAARASNLHLDCADMDREAGGKGAG